MKLSTRIRRLGIAAFSAVGVLDALYMLAFDEGLLEHLWCPFLGDQCEKVGRSEHARHFAVPNAAVGAVGYAAMGSLALWGGTRPASERPSRSIALAGISAGAAAASLYLLYEQKSKIHAYCFWCLLSTGVSLGILGMSLPEVASMKRKNLPDLEHISGSIREALRHPHGPRYREGLPRASGE